MLSNYLKKIRNDNVGVIVNYLSKQFLNRHYNLFDVPPANFVDYLILNNIETIFIDNYLYEEDHNWYGKEINGLIAHAKLNNIKIIIIKNNSESIYNNYLDFPVIEITLNDKTINTKKRVFLPLIIDEHVFNPIDAQKKNDILYISRNKIYRTEGIQALHTNIKPIREEFVLDKLTRQNLYNLFDKIKEAKCIYIYNVENFDPILLRYIELISVLQNSVVLYSSDNTSSPYALNSNDIDLVNQLVILIKDKMSREKVCLPIQRKAFLMQTFSNYENLMKNSEEELSSSNVALSVITSTNRKYNLKQYIHRMNKQKHVNIQIVLITHGFTLTSGEKREIYATLNNNIELEIIPIDESLPLGYCLNTAIIKVKHDYVAKMDDDDFYFSNYLIDSWIAAQYSRADLVGKLATFSYLDGAKLIISKHKNMTRRYNTFVMGATFFCKSDTMKKYMFSYLPTGEDSDFLRRINEDNVSIYIDHPYNFCIYRSGDVGNHTWKISDLEYMKNSEIVSFEKPHNFLSF